MAPMRCALLLAAWPVVRCTSSFDEYLLQFRKSYLGAEYVQRKALFEARVEFAQEHNARPGVLWQAGVSSMWDMTPGELRQRLGYSKMGRGETAAPVLRASRAKDLPEAVDWRKHSPTVLTPVKNQGGCGSCWAVAAAQAIETNIALETGILLDLSPQHLNSCVPNPHQCGGSGGCGGATAQLAFKYAMQAGIADIWAYPYLSGLNGKTGDCWNDTSTVAGISGYKQLEANSATDLMEAVAYHGPVVVSVDASLWFLYSKGIFNSCNKTSPDINHAVQLVGYGEQNCTKYWIIRNSWGADYGENGFIRLQRHDDEPCGWDVTPQNGFGCVGGPPKVRVCGECGLLSDSSYPQGGHLLTGARRSSFSPRRLQAIGSAVMV